MFAKLKSYGQVYDVESYSFGVTNTIGGQPMTHDVGFISQMVESRVSDFYDWSVSYHLPTETATSGFASAMVTSYDWTMDFEV